jgi:PAS domain S-box-containing protein
MVMSALFDNLEPSHSTRPNHGLFEEASRHGGKLEDKSGVSLVPERTSDLVAITTFSLSRYVYASPSHKRVLGYDPSDLLNRCPFDFIHPDDIPKLSPLLDKYVASLSKADAPHGDLKVPTERMLYRITDKWGNWRSMETTGDFLSDELIVLISRDMTERVKAENDLSESLTALQNAAEEHARELTSADEALRESERKYRTILESIEDGYYEVDISGNMVFFNDSMCKLVGYSSEELKGMNNRRYMAEETAKAVYQTFNQVYSTGEGTKVIGWELLRKNGEKRYVETSVSLVRDRKEEPIGFRGIARDITEQKSLEKAKERIINHLSHELATPLSVIEAAAAIIERAVEKGDLGKIRKWAEKSRGHICRLRNLQTQVSDILNSRPVEEKERSLYFIEAALSQLEELKEEPLKESAEAVRQSIVRQLKALYTMEGVRNEEILMDCFLDEVWAEAVLSMRERQIEIIREFDKGISLQMDKTALKKICGGFLRNAIENTPDEGRIEIRLKQEGEYVRMAFQDFGVGITPENQKWIFGGFFHTQDTHNYASKKPYLFNAGGAGADLLRAKVLSERLNLRLEFSSTRCRYLPSDEAECPGRISLCPFVTGREDCLSFGGSLFTLLLPLPKPGPT